MLVMLITRHPGKELIGASYMQLTLHAAVSIRPTRAHSKRCIMPQSQDTHSVLEMPVVRLSTWMTCSCSQSCCRTAGAGSAGTLPPVQKAAFGLFPSLVPLQSQELWPELLDGLIQLLKPHLLEGQLHQQLQQPLLQQVQAQAQAQRQGSFSQRGPAAPSSTNNSLHRPALASLSMEKALDVMLQLYRYGLPSEASP